MTPLITWLKYAWHPATLPFMLSIVAVGVALLYTRFSAWGRRWLTSVAVGYWAMSTPAIAGILAAGVATYDRVETVADARGATAVVLLGGGILTYRADGLAIDDLGASAPRVLEAIRVYRLLDRPLMILSAGNTAELDPPRTEAQAFRTAIRELGVPDARIVLDEASLTTRDEAINIKRILAEHGIERFVIVTGPTHMQRALAAFRAVGLNPVPTTARLRSSVDHSLWSLIPDRESLVISDSVIYEALGWLYYRARGWLPADRHGA